MKEIRRNPQYVSPATSNKMPADGGEKEAKAKILVVEDDVILHRALVVHLEKAGYKVTVAVDGDEAFYKLKASEPDLVILDLMLPGTNGINFLRSYRKINTPPTKFIAFTNSEDQSLRTEVEELGVQGYFVKAHTSLKQLLKEIERVLVLDRWKKGE